MTRVHDEIIDFIAAGCTSEAVAKFVPSQESRDRVAYLLDRLKDDALSFEENAELDQYVEIEHIMTLAKARALQRLGQ